MSKAVKIANIAIAINMTVCMLAFGYFMFKEKGITFIAFEAGTVLIAGAVYLLIFRNPRLSDILSSGRLGRIDLATLKGQYDNELNVLGNIVSMELGNKEYMRFFDVISRKDVLMDLMAGDKRTPKHNYYHILLGIAVVSWPDDISDAISYAQKAVELNPQALLPRHILARAYEAKGMVDEALREYEAAKNSVGAGSGIKEELDGRIERIKANGPEKLSSTSGASLSLLHG